MGIFSIFSVVLISAFIYNLIETFYFDFFSKISFRFGIPAFFQTIDSVKISSSFFTDRIIETNEGKFKFTNNRKLYFRSHGRMFNGRQYEAFPIRSIGTLTDSGHVKIIGKIPVGATVILFGFTFLSIIVFIRDGMSPSMIFFAANWLIFAFSFNNEKRRLEKMIWELEQMMAQQHEKDIRVIE